jgi:hypothetical protein
MLRRLSPLSSRRSDLEKQTLLHPLLIPLFARRGALVAETGIGRAQVANSEHDVQCVIVTVNVVRKSLTRVANADSVAALFTAAFGAVAVNFGSDNPTRIA